MLHHDDILSAGSGFQAVAGAEDPPNEGETQPQERHGQQRADHDVHVRETVEAPSECADEIDDRVEQRDRLPDARQHVDRIERAAEEGQRSDDQHRDHLQLLEVVGPDADHEAEQAEGEGDQHQECQHPDRMLDAQRHEEGGGCQDDEADHDRFRRRGADVADDDLQGRDGGREDLVDGADEAWEIDGEGGVRDALRQHRHQDETRDDKGAVGHALHFRDAAADGAAEHHEIEGRREHRRQDALQRRAPGAGHLETVDRTDCMDVHWALRTRPTKMSSSELWLVLRSVNRMPAAARSCSSPVMPVRSPRVS